MQNQLKARARTCVPKLCYTDIAKFCLSQTVSDHWRQRRNVYRSINIIFTITIQIISITYGAQSSEKETENWFVTHVNKQGLAGKHATSPERASNVQ